MKTKKETDRKVSSIKFKRFRRNEIVPSRNLQTQLYESKHFIFNQYSVITRQITSQLNKVTTCQHLFIHYQYYKP